MAKEAFRHKKFSDESLQIVHHLTEIIDGFAAQNIPRNTLRTVYYQFIARDLFPDTWIDREYNEKMGLDPDTKNTIKNYKKLGDIVSEARLAGLVDWQSIVDLERKVYHPTDFESPTEFVERVLPIYRHDRWEGQENYVEVWVEKNGMTVSIEPVTRKLHVPLVANKGYGSMTNLYEGSKRFLDAAEAGKDCHILYLGDHDPSGLDMDDDIGRRMEMFGASVLVQRIALTTEQVETYNPPPNPAKLTDSRAKEYIKRFGHTSWEVNALSPTDLNDFLERRIEKLIDYGALQSVLKEEEQEKAWLKTTVEKALRDRKKGAK